MRLRVARKRLSDVDRAAATSDAARSRNDRLFVVLPGVVAAVAASICGAAIVGARPAGPEVRERVLAPLDSFRRSARVPVPADNPMTRARVELGKALFFDPRLSGSGAIACATCHQPALGWQDGLARAVGHHGAVLPRRTPTILDVAWAEPLFWDGRADTLEEQAKGPLSAPQEMDMPPGQAAATVQSIAGYRKAFAAAYPGEPITVETMARAIATFERTIVSGIAPFDRWLAGDRDAISPAARRGFALFNSPRTNCSSCHSGWRFTDDGFHDIGLPGTDPGRAKIMPDVPVLDHAFKTPTLRNIAERGPYMHDGSMPTLDAAIDHYARGFIRRPSLAPEMKAFTLTPGEKADLIAFLQSLSSRDPRVTAPIPYR